MSNDMIINHETCSKCGICATICATKSIDHSKGEFPSRNPSRAETCIHCGQCMAICPQGSITISGLTYEDLFDLPQDTPDYQALFDLMSTRRSIRHFENKPVPRELIEKIITATAQAPMGFPPHKTHVTVVQDRSTILKMLPIVTKIYKDLAGWMKNPLIRFIIKRQTTPEAFSTIKNHLMPLISKRLTEMENTDCDEITWEAPALMLFHAERLAENHTVDAIIALTYASLAAHSLGLGALINGLLPPAITQSSELKNILNLPKDHEVVGALLLGYPRYHYQHAIKRPLASVNWI